MTGDLLATSWDFACPDWFERIKAGRPPIADLPLDKAEAERAVRLFNRLRLPDVPGHPTLGEAGGEWFRAIVRAAFGSVDADSGGRRIGEIFTLVAKKNNKTTGSAAIMLTALLMNTRPRAQLLLVGPTQEVAERAYQQAVGMIEADPPEPGQKLGYLQKRFHVRDHKKAIVDRVTKSELKVVTFDNRVMTGALPLIVLLDELHVMARYHYASRVFAQIRGGLGSKPESLLIIITTQSDEPPAGVFKQELQYARGVRDGRITKNVRSLPILYEFPEAMQTDPDKPWLDPRNWALVNPNLGLSIDTAAIAELQARAEQAGEGELRIWASQHLNVEIGLALHSDRWRGADYWEGAADLSITLASLLERCEVIVAGVDGGGLDDLLGLSLLGRCKTTRDWLQWNHAWCHDDVLSLRKDIAERLRDFERDGNLTICREPTQDIEELADLIQRVHEAKKLPQKYGVGLDPVGVSAIIDALAERGIETEANGGPVIAVTQGYRLSGAVWGMERKLKDGTLWHAGQPLMAWCVGNGKTELRGNAVLITKQVSGKAKIDPLIASFNAFMLMSRAPEAAHGFGYVDGKALVA